MPPVTGRGRRTVALVILVSTVALSACTASESESDNGTTSSTRAESTTTEPPVILALAPNLGLSPEQCFAEIPLVETTTTTAAPTTQGSDTDDAPTTTLDAIDQALETTTTLPRPPTVAVVDCGSTNLGQVYATFCLGTAEDDEGQLTSVACPGDPESSYPGDRAIRRAAARVCLQRFEEAFGEDYAASTRIAQEFTPTEGVWELGDHRVVCHSVTGQ